ncbi:MAG: zinc ribbon domain-containing protein [Acidobacteria bacterium]|nr:MAG: zinc ribbon domain-containing protein [Acidobacteriota bacterium]
MPIYEYRCEACGDEFEVMQKFSDRPLKRCGKCGGPLEKLISRSSFVLKGGGWFADGYGRSRSGGERSGKKRSGEGEKSDAKGGGEGAPGARPAAAAAASR